MDKITRLGLLAAQVRSVLEKGKILVIFCWLDRNHSNKTRRIPDNRVHFLERPPDVFPKNTGLIIMTPFVRHPDRDRARRQATLHPDTVEVGQIKRILTSVEDLLTCPEHSTMGEILPCTAHRVQTTSAVFEKSHACTSIGHKEILSSFLIHQPQPESKETSIDETMQKFSEAFLNASREHPEGFVGRVILARILKSLDITDTPRKLIRDGMLEAVIPKKIGQKIGWYRSGPKMVSDIKSSPEPRNDYERAQIAIARKPSLLAEIEQLERRLQEVNNELHKIEQIELFLTKIGAILE